MLCQMHSIAGSSMLFGCTINILTCLINEMCASKVITATLSTRVVYNNFKRGGDRPCIGLLFTGYSLTTTVLLFFFKMIASLFEEERLMVFATLLANFNYLLAYCRAK